MAELIDVPPGLAGVAVAETEIGDVVGEKGFYHYRGRSAPDLARRMDFETVAALVLDESSEPLPSDRSLPEGLADLVGHVDLLGGLGALCRALDVGPLTTLDPAEQRAHAARIISVLPTLVASIRHGRPIEPDPSLGVAADYLRMLNGTPASDEQVAALDAYLVLTIDHGFNNSTFATRVVASSGADLAMCVVAGFCSLSGPRHGADVERILDMYDEIGEPSRAEQWLKQEVAGGRRLQGFGHSAYRVADPRLVLLREIGAELSPERHAMAMAVEEAGLRVLAGRRGLAPNLDLHAPVVLEGAGVPRGWFTETFAVARVVGWCAHAVEQVSQTKLMRPSAHYFGPPPDLDVY